MVIQDKSLQVVHVIFSGYHTNLGQYIPNLYWLIKQNIV